MGILTFHDRLRGLEKPLFKKYSKTTASIRFLPKKAAGQVGDTAIHVTTAPSEALIRKCCDNLAQSLRPLIITTSGGVGGALALAKNANVADRIDILEIEQFIATNVYEWTSFEDTKRAMTVSQLVNTYNHIIDTCETDHSLKITIG
jgi:hypothetical protein